MAWPPAALPVNMTDATPQQTTHPNLHNTTSLAVNDTVAHVQQIDSAIAGSGVALTQTGMVVASGAVTAMQWDYRSSSEWGTGASLVVPAGQGGVFVTTLRITGPQIQVGAFADVVLVVNGVEFSNYIPGSKASIAFTVQATLAPGQAISAKVYNPLPSSQYFGGGMLIARSSI